ncbi:MAG: HAD hydrolase family protein [Firmicutes bacterium]|jgi:soluble P-type ATPase|nr:HAD hydrolase family protein [Bacillota bacterium]
MLIYEVPGRGRMEIENVVFDYNGTLAIDGKLILDIKELLLKLKKRAKVVVLTADTYGSVRKECSFLGEAVMAFPREGASKAKREIVEKLGASRTICIGNGFNDIEMFKIAALSIAVIEREGCSGRLLTYADIVVTSIQDAMEIILSPNRIKATLRT